MDRRTPRLRQFLRISGNLLSSRPVAGNQPRSLRSGSCGKRADLAAEVTVTAAERLAVDAAILFADILLILEPLGFNLEFAQGEGPVIHNPVRVHGDVDRVRPLSDPASLDYVFQAVRAIRAALPPDLPLIGFAGAP